MNNQHITGSDNGASNNTNPFAIRRTGSLTGALPIIGPERNYHSSSSFNFDEMLQSLRDLFEHDRQIASQPEATRCGVCYLHFQLSGLQYREEGFYICSGCEHTLGKQSMFMLRQQQKL